MLTAAVLELALGAYTATIKLLILCIEDQPPEERRKAWARWFQFWAPMWKALGLTGEDPIKAG